MVMNVLFSVFCLVVLFCVLFVCNCVLYCTVLYCTVLYCTVLYYCHYIISYTNKTQQSKAEVNNIFIISAEIANIYCVRNEIPFPVSAICAFF